MIHKSRASRRYQRNKKIEQRLKIRKELGAPGGTIYEKHNQKIDENGGGYMAKHGTLKHYSKASHYGRKTTARDKYGKVTDYKRLDQQRLDEMEYEESHLDEELDMENFNPDFVSCEGCRYREPYDGRYVCVHRASIEGIEAYQNYYECEEIKNCMLYTE